MSDLDFTTFGEAGAAAKDLARNSGRAVRVVRHGDKFRLVIPERTVSESVTPETRPQPYAAAAAIRPSDGQLGDVTSVAPPAIPNSASTPVGTVAARATDLPPRDDENSDRAFEGATVQQIIEVIRDELEKSPNEHRVLEYIQKGLDLLRSRYRSAKNAFTPGEIKFLESLSGYREIIQEFFDAIDDAVDVRTKDDAIEVATRFIDISEKLGSITLAKRALKEARELAEKVERLPSAHHSAEEAEKRRRESLLSKDAPSCKKCTARMRLRESQFGYFWGCSRFPDCFSRRRLTKSEADVLYGRK